MLLADRRLARIDLQSWDFLWDSRPEESWNEPEILIRKEDMVSKHVSLGIKMCEI